MYDLFGIQMKKAVYKPLEAIYFLSPDLEVASWFYYQDMDFPGVPKTLVHITPDWQISSVEPLKALAGVDVSPAFQIAPVTIYGSVAAHSPAGGTTYHKWFTPVVTVDDNNPVPEAYASQVTGKSVVKLNMWRKHHIFQGWESV